MHGPMARKRRSDTQLQKEVETLRKKTKRKPYLAVLIAWIFGATCFAAYAWFVESQTAVRRTEFFSECEDLLSDKRKRGQDKLNFVQISDFSSRIDSVGTFTEAYFLPEISKPQLDNWLLKQGFRAEGTAYVNDQFEMVAKSIGAKDSAVIVLQQKYDAGFGVPRLPIRLGQ